MPKQNRVTPFGDIVATPARGTFMGNRGVLHNEEGQMVRPSQGKRWLICQLSFKGRQRVVLTPSRYTELFFLDEATALAAGHRPCVECRREAYLTFREAWVAGQPGIGKGVMPKVEEIDRVLHQERISETGGKVTYRAQIGELPDGTFVVVDGRPCLLWQNRLFPWSFTGYDRPINRVGNQTAAVLTPHSTVAALAHGYMTQVHESVRG